MSIIRNSVRCLSCGEEIESTSRHDFVSCSCGSVSVDGGHEYLRRGWCGEAGFEDTSICHHESQNARFATLHADLHLPFTPLDPDICTDCATPLTSADLVE